MTVQWYENMKLLRIEALLLILPIVNKYSSMKRIVYIIIYDIYTYMNIEYDTPQYN